MRGLARRLFYPLRRMATRILVTEDIVTTRTVKPIDLAADYVCSEEVPGDYLEFGVFRGASFIEAYRKLERSIDDWSSRRRAFMAYTDKARAREAAGRVSKRSMRYFAFDSFDGLPEPRGADRDHPRFSKGRYDCGEVEFKKIIRDNGVDLGKVVVVPGYYEKTLVKETKDSFGIRSASIVMIDCDLYESARLALEFITDLVNDGTIIIFDDWFDFRGKRDHGEQRACREWLDKNPGISLERYARWDASQLSFIVSKKRTQDAPDHG